MTLKHGLHHWIVSEYELAHPVHFLCFLYTNVVKNLIEFGSHWIHIIPGLFMNFFNTDALSGACAGSLLEKIPYAEEKKIRCGNRSLDPYFVKLKHYHLDKDIKDKEALFNVAYNVTDNISS